MSLSSREVGLGRHDNEGDGRERTSRRCQGRLDLLNSRERVDDVARLTGRDDGLRAVAEVPLSVHGGPVDGRLDVVDV